MTENLSDEHGSSFVERIVQDPKKPPSALLLAGFLGASSQEGHTRLYFDGQLGRYADIPDEAVLHTEDLPVEISPLGGALVWIDQNAEAFRDKGGSAASFLQGHLTQDKTVSTQPPPCPQAQPGGSTQGDSKVSQQTFPFTLVPPYCPTQGSQAQGAAIPSIPVSQCLTIPIVCCPLPAGQGQGFQGQAQGGFPTIWPPCGGQAQGASAAAIPSIPVSQCLTIPIVCCPLPAAQGQGFQGQAQGGFPTVFPLCGGQGAGQSGAAQTVFPTITILPPCPFPTIWPPCGGQAQGASAAAIPSIPVSQCLTIPIVCC